MIYWVQWTGSHDGFIGGTYVGCGVFVHEYFCAMSIDNVRVAVSGLTDGICATVEGQC